MTPLHIQLMLHYYAVAEPYAKNDLEHATSRAVSDYTKELLEYGLIVKDVGPSGFKSTDRGNAYVQMLCNLPLPVCKWVAP